VADISIRAAHASVVSALAVVYRRASLANSGDRETLLANPDALAFSLDPAGRTRVAAVDGDVVGFATLLAVAGSGELEDLFVAPEWMGRGVGRALVLDAIAAARAARMPRIDVTANGHALGFYERVGFVLDGPAETQFGPAHRMHLDVDARTS
jgi:GNAT superfamily N-acetyltransferase